jgi:hypothetical protein
MLRPRPRRPTLFRGPPKYDYSPAKGRRVVDSVFKDFEHYLREDGVRIQKSLWDRNFDYSPLDCKLVQRTKLAALLFLPTVKNSMNIQQ